MHSADQVQGRRGDGAGLRVENARFTDMRLDDAPDHHHLIRAEGQGRMHDALERDWRSSHPRRFDLVGWCGVELGKPHLVNPGGASMQVTFMASARAADTRFTTNSPVAWMFWPVSFI